jgi:zeta-carotene desaturase
MGVPAVALRELYDADALLRAGNIQLKTRCPIERLCPDGVEAAGARHTADYYISALPFERLASVAPWLGIEPDRLEHSPITGIHVWYDRPVTNLPHATLLGRTLQWMFNKHQGRYLQFVVSASRSLTSLPRQDVIALASKEAAEFFPEARVATMLRAQVIKEVRATFSAIPGAERLRPGALTASSNVFLAGDWTQSGWPATMEGAVRSGYLAAEAVCAAAGRPQRFLIDN